MKPLLAIFAGFTVALGMFGAGIAGTVLFLSLGPEPHTDTDQNVAQLWSVEPRPVDTASQQLERVPGVEVASATTADTGVVSAAAAAEASDDQAVDTFTTAALPEQQPRQDPADAYVEELIARHVEWCDSRYRSYRVEDDSYTPYSGGRRACISPYAEEMAAAYDDRATYPAGTTQAAYETVSADDDASYEVVGGTYDEGYAMADLSASHIEDCFSRYRSYRPEDNTYQPYGGGPRRACR